MEKIVNYIKEIIKKERSCRLLLLFLEIILAIFIAYINGISIVELFGDFWFTAGILLIVLLTLVDQPFYSKDANIFINASTAFVSLFLLNKNDSNLFLVIGIVYLLLSSYLLMFIRNNPLNEEKIAVQMVSRFNRVIGNPKFLFSFCFLYGIVIKIKNSPSFNFVPFLCFWAFIIIADFINLVRIISESICSCDIKKEDKIVGSIMGVEGNNIYLVKIFDKAKFKINLFDQFSFTYDNKKINVGIVIDLYFLDEKQWAKIMSIDNYDIKDEISIKKNYIYKSNLRCEKTLDLEKNFIGIICKNSMIDRISFVYNTNVKVEQGMLVKVNIREEEILYQIINGITHEEILEEKNKNINIIVDAIQLGKWDKKYKKFDKFGWIPQINTPVYIANNSDLDNAKEEDEGFMVLGTIFDSNSSYQVLMDVEKAISHHIAILGVTGTGKSILARRIINCFESIGNKKIFIIDFTNEYKLEYPDVNNLINKENEKILFEKFKSLNIEMSKYPNQRDYAEIENNKTKISEVISSSINDFIHSENKKVLIELPDLENNENISDYIRFFFKEIFRIAKENMTNEKFPRCLIVLEEAHTIIPEWNFTGEDSKTNASTLNAIAQIALQGRKYKVGLMVIAQRTAIVSKTILTQCNTVIAFQIFDKTSMDFLSNYFGENYANILPTLKFRQAVASGKGFSSTVPLVFEVPENKSDGVLKS